MLMQHLEHNSLFHHFGLTVAFLFCSLLSSSYVFYALSTLFAFSAKLSIFLFKSCDLVILVSVLHSHCPCLSTRYHSMYFHVLRIFQHEVFFLALCMYALRPSASQSLAAVHVCIVLRYRNGMLQSTDAGG